LFLLLILLDNSQLIALYVSLKEAFNWEGIVDIDLCLGAKFGHFQIVELHVDQLEVVLAVEFKHHLPTLLETHHLLNRKFLENLTNSCLAGLSHTLAATNYDKTFSPS
jgi:hypothetical protein